MSTAPTQFILPDLLSMCPFEGSFNPHHAKASAESSAWVQSYNVFSGRKNEFFLQGGSELLCAYAFPYAGHEQLRTCCDFVNLLFAVDEISDEQDGKDALQTGYVCYNAMRNADWNDGSKLAKMSKDFRNRFLRFAGPKCFRRFLEHFKNYIEAVAKEADYREHGHILDMDSFRDLRRENSAVRTCFGLVGYILNIDLPDEVVDNPVFLAMHLAAVDMVCWSNDIYSYRMEAAMGHTTNNIMSVLMKNKNLDLQGAADYVGVYFKALIDDFIANKSRLPSWGVKVDREVADYVMAMEKWVVGNLNWSFDTQRYFGVERHEIKRTRVVRLRSQI